MRMPKLTPHPSHTPAGVTEVTGVLVGRVTAGGTGGSGAAGGAGGPDTGVVVAPILLAADACTC